MLFGKAERRIDQLLDMLEDRCYTDLPGASFSPWRYGTTTSYPGEEIPKDLEWHPMELPFEYGCPWTSWWFSCEITLPPLSTPDAEFFLRLETETDTMVYLNRKPEAAVNPFHRKVRMTPWAGETSRTFSLALEAWAGHEYPGFHPSEKGRVLTTVSMHDKKAYPLHFDVARLLVRNPHSYGLYYDVFTLRDLSKTLDPSSFWYQKIISTLHSVLMELDIVCPDVAEYERQAAVARKKLEPLLQAKNGTFTPQVVSIGNSHLDHAWLWPIAETTRKAARTCCNMVAFCNEYPEFSFMFSQPVQMDAVAKQYPSVYEKVLKAYRAGQWEPNGVSFVEPDCVLPSGESMIRQFLYGRALTSSLFPGYRGDTFWIPDSFGYMASLPQILVGCGVSYFVTSKLSWNDTNQFPYDLFLWEGVDGTRIPAHLIVDAYTGLNEPQAIMASWNKVQHKDIQPTLLRSIGEGDGGGGTRRCDLEIMRRIRDLQGLPKNSWTTLSKAVRTVFSECSQPLPVYRGELYLELHRGTFTSQAKLKQFNRRLEAKLHNAEYLSSLYLLHMQGTKQPLVGTLSKDVLDRLSDSITAVWKTVLVNQFHDILPGSSIHRVVVEAMAAYEDAEKLLDETLALLLGDSSQRKNLWNPNPFPYSLNMCTSISAYGVMADDDISPAPETTVSQQRGHIEVSTEWGNLIFDPVGGISSCVFHGNGRELVQTGDVFNKLTIGEDYPMAWDAWDIDSDSLDKQRRILSMTSRSYAEDSATVRIKQTYTLHQESTLEQEIIINKTIPRIDFRTKVDWKETHQLLQVKFPTTIVNDQAFYDIPFGYIQRSTTRNTAFERARFEVSAHKWAMLGDQELSVALMSDCKYGYSVTAGELSLSLLRSPTAPDPDADRGIHEFTYALVLSTDGLPTVMSHGYALNNPPVAVADEVAVLLQDPICQVVGSESIVVETVKPAEKRDGLILRLREVYGTTASCSLALHPMLDSSSLTCTNMIEEPVDDVSVATGRYQFHPFEVKTLWVTWKV